MIELKGMPNSVCTMHNNKIQEARVWSITYFSDIHIRDSIEVELVEVHGGYYDKSKRLTRSGDEVLKTKQELLDSL